MAEPLSHEEAARVIAGLAKHPLLTLIMTEHAKDRMNKRGLLSGDVMFVLKSGMVREAPEASTQDGYFKYRMESLAPNSDSRMVGVVAIPSMRDRRLKVLSVMWVDEGSTACGSFFGE